MPYRLGIIGGGWYGCHIASSLKALGFEVKLFEKSSRLLNQASGNNQFRLHLGFHYPRHAGTRIQSREGFSKFMERYGALSYPVESNLYAVPARTSLIDFDTYKLIMTSSGIPYRTISEASSSYLTTSQAEMTLADVEGIIEVPERVLLLEKARRYFSEHLHNEVSLNHEISSIVQTDRSVTIDGIEFDYAIDATWGHFSPLAVPTFYEPTILLYFEASAKLPAITFVDGPLYSLYPTESPTIYTLSSVPHTPLGRYENAGAARHARDRVNADVVKRKLHQMVEQAKENIPNIEDHLRFLGPQLSIKTKPVGQSDDRSCYVERKGRLFCVLSGKIDTIFFATERILAMIEAEGDTLPSEVHSLLSEDIMNINNNIDRLHEVLPNV